MSNCEWKAIERDYKRHSEVVLRDRTTRVNVIKVANLNTEREQRVIMCQAFCPVCRGYMQALIWRRTSPLNRLKEKMPLIADRHEAAAPR